MGSLAENYSRN